MEIPKKRDAALSSPDPTGMAGACGLRLVMRPPAGKDSCAI